MKETIPSEFAEGQERSLATYVAVLGGFAWKSGR